MVLEGLKPVCDIELYNPDRSAYQNETSYQEWNREYQNTVSKLEELLKKFSLPYSLTFHKKDDRDDEPRYEVAIFLVGKDEASLQALLDSDSAEEAGHAFGMPDTAVSAYVDSKIKNRETLPSEVLSSDYIHFLDFRLSEDHWQEELESVKRRAEEVKRLTPDLYEKIIFEGKNSKKSIGVWKEVTENIT